MLGNATTSLHRTTTRCPLRAPRCRNFVAAAARRHYSTTRDDSRKEKIKSVAVLGSSFTLRPCLEELPDVLTTGVS